MWTFSNRSAASKALAAVVLAGSMMALIGGCSHNDDKGSVATMTPQKMDEHEKQGAQGYAAYQASQHGAQLPAAHQ